MDIDWDKFDKHLEERAQEERNQSLYETIETRASSWKALSHGSSFTSGARLTYAENLTTVLACVNAIASSIAGLPFYVYRNTSDGRKNEPKHALARLTRQGPNPWQTWPDFNEWLIAECLLNGNAVAEIVTDNQGRVKELIPIPWSNVSVQMLKSGRLVYDVHDITSIHGGTGRQRRLLQEEVLHVRDRSDDGLIGRSRLARARLGVASALKTQEYASSMWDNQATPSGVISMKKPLNSQGLKNIRKEFEELYAGVGNARAVAVLDNDMSFTPVTISAEDAELLASRRFSVEEMARIYGVPPTIIGDLTNSSFTNAETLLRYFSQFTLRAWATKLEAEIQKSIFTSYERERLTVEYDMSSFLRGDPTTRWTAHKIAVDSQILTVNEIREIEGFNPLNDEVDT